MFLSRSRSLSLSLYICIHKHTYIPNILHPTRKHTHQGFPPTSPRPDLWMPDGPNKLPDGSIDGPNLNKCKKTQVFHHRSRNFLVDLALGILISHIYREREREREREGERARERERDTSVKPEPQTPGPLRTARGDQPRSCRR